jgi:hypothetical protein
VHKVRRVQLVPRVLKVPRVRLVLVTKALKEARAHKVPKVARVLLERRYLDHQVGSTLVLNIQQ